MRNLLRISIALLVLTAAACGGGSDGDSAQTVGADDAGDQQEQTESDGDGASADTEEATAEEGTADSGSSDEDGGAVSSGSGSATLILGNGESFEFGILCALEPQGEEGREILFTVVSYDAPYNLDVTQFGADSFGGAANISVYDSETYDTVWEATSQFGGEVELLLEGSTVTGQGAFWAGGEPGGEETSGRLIANC